MPPYAWSINGQEFPKADPIKLAAEQNVRFIMENPTMMDHPFHLHGHYFRVLGTPDKLNLTDPVQKDSVNVPAKSTLVLQWETDQPRPLVLPLPHRMALGHRHGPGDRNRLGVSNRILTVVGSAPSRRVAAGVESAADKLPGPGPHRCPTDQSRDN